MACDDDASLLLVEKRERHGGEQMEEKVGATDTSLNYSSPVESAKNAEQVYTSFIIG